MVLASHGTFPDSQRHTNQDPARYMTHTRPPHKGEITAGPQDILQSKCAHALMKGTKGHSSCCSPPSCNKIPYGGTRMCEQHREHLLVTGPLPIQRLRCLHGHKTIGHGARHQHNDALHQRRRVNEATSHTPHSWLGSGRKYS